MLKNKFNSFQINYVIIWKWRIDLNYNVSNLNSKQRHMIAITWNENDAIILYIDWKEVQKEQIIFN